MLEHGFARSSYDCCVYFKHVSNNISLYLLLYADNMLIASQSREKIQQLKLDSKSTFEMKDLGKARKILGIEIKRDKKIRTLGLSQENYLRKLIQRFGMAEAKAVNTPFA